VLVADDTQQPLLEGEIEEPRRKLERSRPQPFLGGSPQSPSPMKSDTNAWLGCADN
jgi:hypothetical protein